MSVPTSAIIVIPAQAGIQGLRPGQPVKTGALDSRLRGNDEVDADRVTHNPVDGSGTTLLLSTGAGRGAKLSLPARHHGSTPAHTLPPVASA